MSAAPVFVALALAFGVAAYRRPSFAVAGLVLVDPFALYRYVGPTTMTSPKAALIGFAVGLALRRPSPKSLVRPQIFPTLLAAIAVIFATALSFAQADYKEPAIRETLKAVEYVLVYVVCVIAIDSDRSDRSFAAASFAAGAAVALIAMVQAFAHPSSSLWIVAGHRAIPRLAGPLEGPNQLAGYLALLLPVMAAYMLAKRASPLAWLTFAIVAAAEALTFSRGGVIGSLVALAVVALFAGGRWRAASLAAAIAIASGIAAVVVAGGNVVRSWSAQSQPLPAGLGTREQLWTAAYRLWRSHPWLGIGAGNYEFELSRAGFPELRTHPNGQYLQALVEGGVPLFAALVWATLQPIWSLVRSGSRHPAAIGALGALAGLAVHQIVDSMTFFPKVGMMAWIVAGVGLSFASHD